MKAVVYGTYGGPEVLEVAEVPDPTVGPDSVLVAVRAAAVNPVDWKVREGYLDGALDAFFPVVPGWDVAGVVERPGVAAPEFAEGDEVIGYVREDVPDGVSAILDLVGGDALAVTSEVAAEGARIVSVADTSVVDLGGGYLFVRPDRADLTALVELVEAGAVTVEVTEVFPLERAADAHRRNAEGHTRGKIVVEVA